MDVINRMLVAKPAAYDDIAEIYDDMWTGWEARQENNDVRDDIDYSEGESVLDIGCGTGLFLDMLKRAHRGPKKPTKYLGIDPSEKMLAVLHKKHKHAKTIETTFEALFTTEKFNLIIALFGTASYVTPEILASDIPKLLAPGGRYYLMFYRAGYEPVTHKKAGKAIPFTPYRAELLPGLSRGPKLLGNFMVLKGWAPSEEDRMG